MGNFDERIRQAFGARDEAKRLSEMRGKEIQREKEKRDAEHRVRRMQELREARIMLDRIRPCGLLEHIKQSVWKVGEVITKEHEVDGTISIDLVYKHMIWVSLTPMDGGGGVSPRGRSECRHVVGISARFRIKEGIVERHFDIGGNHVGRPPIHVKVEAEDYIKARNHVEQTLADFCEAQILNKMLPLDCRRSHEGRRS